MLSFPFLVPLPLLISSKLLFKLMGELFCAKVLQLCLTLCDPMDWSPPWGSPGKNTGVGWPCLPPGDLPDTWTEPMSLLSPTLAEGVFTTSTSGKSKSIDMGLLLTQEAADTEGTSKAVS